MPNIHCNSLHNTHLNAASRLKSSSIAASTPRATSRSDQQALKQLTPRATWRSDRKFIRKQRGLDPNLDPLFLSEFIQWIDKSISKNVLRSASEKGPCFVVKHRECPLSETVGWTSEELWLLGALTQTHRHKQTHTSTGATARAHTNTRAHNQNLRARDPCKTHFALELAFDFILLLQLL